MQLKAQRQKNMTKKMTQKLKILLPKNDFQK